MSVDFNDCASVQLRLLQLLDERNQPFANITERFTFTKNFYILLGCSSPMPRLVSNAVNTVFRKLKSSSFLLFVKQNPSYMEMYNRVKEVYGSSLRAEEAPERKQKARKRAKEKMPMLVEETSLKKMNEEFLDFNDLESSAIEPMEMDEECVSRLLDQLNNRVMIPESYQQTEWLKRQIYQERKSAKKLIRHHKRYIRDLDDMLSRIARMEENLTQ